MRRTGGWALSNQPHCVVSSVAGKRCSFLPPGRLTMRRFGSGGPALGNEIVAVGGGGCGAAGCGGAWETCCSAACCGAGCAASSVEPAVFGGGDAVRENATAPAMSAAPAAPDNANINRPRRCMATLPRSRPFLQAKHRPNRACQHRPLPVDFNAIPNRLHICQAACLSNDHGGAVLHDGWTGLNAWTGGSGAGSG